MPSGWPDLCEEARSKQRRASVRSQAEALGLTFGDPAALKSLRAGPWRQQGRHPAPPRGPRRPRSRPTIPSSPPTLQALLDDPAAPRPRRPRARRATTTRRRPAAILKAYPAVHARRAPRRARTRWRPASATRRALLAARSSRPARREATSRPTSSGSCATTRTGDRRTDRQGLGHRPRDAGRQGKAHRAITRSLLTTKPKQQPDPSLGRAVFARTCQQCHTLFDVGGKVGPS